MRLLILSFLKIFFRNRKAMFFVLLLPAMLFLLLAFLGVENVIQFTTPLSYVDFLLPGIIVYSFMQMGIYTVSYNLIDYRRTLVLKRLSVTRLTSFKFLFSQIMARLIIAFIQTALLIAISLVLFSPHFRGSLILLPVIIFWGTAIFLNFGFIIASYAREYEEAAPYTTVLGVGFGFMGDVFFPVSNLPFFLQKIADFLPMKPLVELMRYSFFGIVPEKIWAGVIVLVVWMILSLVVAEAGFRRRAYR